MSCLAPGYNPIPAKVWSRVESTCTYPSTNTNTNNTFYIPILKKTVNSQSAVSYELEMLNKGNVLQYKNNSSNLTKKQRYSQIAKGMWTNRNTTWATQTQTYTNPNIKNLKRVNYTNIFLISGIETTDPITCPDNYADTPIESIVIPNGGTLICNAIENICTGETIVKPNRNICNPTSDSNVPGPIINLCWNNGLPTWYPRQRYIMGSSGNKFPTNYKALVSGNSIKSNTV